MPCLDNVLSLDNMPALDSMPAEIFQEIGSYLAFFDKTSLSLTSKKCRTLLGPFDCPDYFSWAGYLAMNTHCFPSDKQTYLIPEVEWGNDLRTFHNSLILRSVNKDVVLGRVESLEGQLRLHYSSLAKLGWFKDANEDRLRLEKPTNPHSSHQSLASLGLSPLMSEYFPGLKYPQCTLAYFYIKHIKEIVKLVNSAAKQKEDLAGAEEGAEAEEAAWSDEEAWSEGWYEAEAEAESEAEA